MTGRDIRYGRRGGRWIETRVNTQAPPSPAAPPLAGHQLISEARAIMAIMETFPGVRVISAPRGMAELCGAIAREGTQ